MRQENGMPFIQVDAAKELNSDQLAEMRERIVAGIHDASGSARPCSNVAIQEIACLANSVNR